MKQFLIRNPFSRTTLVLLKGGESSEMKDLLLKVQGVADVIILDRYTVKFTIGMLYRVVNVMIAVNEYLKANNWYETETRPREFENNTTMF